MSSDDDELVREINKQAEQAVDIKPALVDLKELSITLAGSFQDATAEEIEELLKDAWRERRLNWVA
jgi:hypothetical protein